MLRENKIIELFGDYWHNKLENIEIDKRRLKTYKKFNFKVLVIWEHELKDLEKVKERILQFYKE